MESSLENYAEIKLTGRRSKLYERIDQVVTALKKYGNMGYKELGKFVEFEDVLCQNVILRDIVKNAEKMGKVYIDKSKYKHVICLDPPEAVEEVSPIETEMKITQRHWRTKQHIKTVISLLKEHGDMTLDDLHGLTGFLPIKYVMLAERDGDVRIDKKDRPYLVRLIEKKTEEDIIPDVDEELLEEEPEETIPKKIISKPRIKTPITGTYTKRGRPRKPPESRSDTILENLEPKYIEERKPKFSIEDLIKRNKLGIKLGPEGERWIELHMGYGSGFLCRDMLSVLQEHGEMGVTELEKYWIFLKPDEQSVDMLRELQSRKVIELYEKQ